MKNFIAILLGLALFALSAPAQVSVINVGITNSVINNATTSTSMGNVINVSKQDFVGMEFRGQGDRAGTGIQTLTFARSTDGTTFETTPRFTWTLSLNGNTAIVGYTNFPNAVIGGAHSIKLVSIANADASATVTNTSLRVLLKRVP